MRRTPPPEISNLTVSCSLMPPRPPSLRQSRGRSRSPQDHPDRFLSTVDRAVAEAFDSALQKSEPDPSTPAQQSPPKIEELETPQVVERSTFTPETSMITPIPARMLNEFVYCPRLFYYEFVEAVFVESDDTIRGRTLHKHVDKGTGALPSPETLPEIIHSRSVFLGSERLGITAKLDLVESAATNNAAPFSVRPVDYKAGGPRQEEDGADLWPTDRMQLGLQILLLRENGYLCDGGIIYYRATKQRVSLEWSDDLEQWILSQIESARHVAKAPIPPPLEGSPKCTRCSLNTICLPDETRLFQQAEPSTPRTDVPSHLPSPAPRRLIAPRDDSRALYLNTPGLHVGRKDDRLIVKEATSLIDEIRLSDISQVSLFGNIQISTQAVQILCEKEIPIAFFSMGGWFYGITRGHGLKNVFTRIEQFQTARDPLASLSLARNFVHGKIRNHRTMLMRLHREPPSSVVAKMKVLAEQALQAKAASELLGIEGAAAALYFGEFAGLIKAGGDMDDTPDDLRAFTFDFAGRNRRPPSDPVNALLSLAYSLLSKDCTFAAAAVGFDPYVGFYHQPRFGRPALALDVMEEFRPLIAESAVLSCINNGMIRPRHFVTAGSAVNLTPEGRKIFFQCYEQRINSLITHPLFDYKVSYRRVLELQFRILARFLTHEIRAYQPFLTR